MRLQGGERQGGPLPLSESSIQSTDVAAETPDNWVALDFRQDPRGRWMGEGPIVDTVRYVDADEPMQPWPWVPRYWRASDLPELRVDAPPMDEPVEPVPAPPQPAKTAAAKKPRRRKPAA